MKHIKKFGQINEKAKKTEIRLERRGKQYAFVKIVDGDAKNGEDISITYDQRTAIEKILNPGKVNESAPIYEVESEFEKTSTFKEASSKVGQITGQLESDFYVWCEENGHEGAEGSSDYDMTFGNILNTLIQR